MTDPTPHESARVLDWVLRNPWPWPTAGGHVRLDCPHYKAPAKPIVGRNPQIGCRKVDATWVHGRPHDCPIHARGTWR